MRIKKHSSGNHYLLTEEGMWVRDFTRPMTAYVDINQTIKQSDHFLFLQNEVVNARERYPWVDSEHFDHDAAVIVSDGFNFAKRHQLLSSLPQNVAILGVNGALAKWQSSRSINYYVVNNPYKECLNFLPRRNRALPRCVASCRTNFEFLMAYRGVKFRYKPVSEAVYGGVKNTENEYEIDDYRNPVCAALGLAYRFNVRRIVLLCCDDAFAEGRPGATQMHNGLWMYSQQKVCHGLIDGCLYWLANGKQGSVVTKDCSDGPLYRNAEYISEGDVLSFLGG